MKYSIEHALRGTLTTEIDVGDIVYFDDTRLEVLEILEEPDRARCRADNGMEGISSVWDLTLESDYFGSQE